jgi:hypothetical protein
MGGQVAFTEESRKHKFRSKIMNEIDYVEDLGVYSQTVSKYISNK